MWCLLQGYMYVLHSQQSACYTLIKGIQLCQEMNLHQVLFDGDAKLVVDGVNGNDDFYWKDQLIDDIQHLISAHALKE